MSIPIDFDPTQKQPENNIQIRSILTPPKKQAKFSSNFSSRTRRPKPPSALALSVPDFSSALWKENRKPPPLPPVAERSLTPTAAFSKSGSIYGKVGGGGSKSANSAEKRSGGLMTRKSYASMAELKGLTAAAAKKKEVQMSRRVKKKKERGEGRFVNFNFSSYHCYKPSN